jgi:hypothetical protein
LFDDHDVDGNGELARVIVVAEDVLAELDRWSAYAQSAVGDAFIAMRHAERMVADVVREAAFVSNLTQQTDLDRDSLIELVRDACSAANDAIAELLARRERWRHTRQISEDAVATWAATQQQAEHDVVEGRARLSKLQRREERIAAKLASRTFLARRSSAELGDELVEVRTMTCQCEADVAASTWASQQADAATTLAEQALALAVIALDQVEHGLRSAELATAHADAAARSFALMGQILGRQGESSDVMKHDAMVASRSVALSRQLLGLVDDAYNDARLQWALIRRDLGDRVEDWRATTVATQPATGQKR